MNGGVGSDDLAKAARAIFGPGFALPANLGGEAWRRELREAFLRRARERYTDGALERGGRPPEPGGLAALADAYRLLSLAGGKAPPPGPPAEVRRPAETRPIRVPAAPARGRPPPRRLQFAEYLYYAGRIAWRDLAASVAWQRRQRPPVGRIAVEWGHLSAGEVRQVLEARRRDGRDEPFGQCALRLGLLTSAQLLAILGHQRRLQRRIGDYFVESGFFGAGEMALIEQEFSRHNARWWRC